MPMLERIDDAWAISDRALPEFSAPDSGADAIEVPTDHEPDEQTASAKDIAIRFDAFNDGRGLSLAAVLRDRLGFTGRLYAVGEVHEDVLHYMVRCGFDALDLREGADPETALALLSPYSNVYQGSVIDQAPNYRRESRGSSR